MDKILIKKIPVQKLAETSRQWKNIEEITANDEYVTSTTRHR